jgi:hypothetical protein
MMKKLLTVVVLLVIFHGYGLAQAHATPGGSPMDDVEYEVLAAVLAQELNSSSPGWVMLAPLTATFECNPPAHNGLSFGPCGGMRTQDQKPEEVLHRVQAAIPLVSADLTADLLRKTQQSDPITRTLPVPAKQFVVDLGGHTKPPYQGSPALAFYPSRVGLNTERNRALVYVGVINWADAAHSLGKYIYLEKADSQWKIKGTLKVWSLPLKSSRQPGDGS